MNEPSGSGIEPCIDFWDASECLAFLEAEGTDAPEYDLETDLGIEMLRRDCRILATRQTEAA